MYKFRFIISLFLLFNSELNVFSQITIPTFFGIQSTKSCEIINNGLTIHYDVGNPNSYSGSGTTLSDLSGNGYDAILRNNLQNNYNNGSKVIFQNLGVKKDDRKLSTRKCRKIHKTTNH